MHYLKKYNIKFGALVFVFICLIPEIILSQSVITNKFTELMKPYFINYFCVTPQNNIWAVVGNNLVKYLNKGEIKYYHLSSLMEGNLEKYEEKNIDTTYNKDALDNILLVYNIINSGENIIIYGRNYRSDNLIFLKITNDFVIKTITPIIEFTALYDITSDENDIIWFQCTLKNCKNVPYYGENILFRMENNKLEKFLYFNSDLEYLKFFKTNEKIYFLSLLRDFKYNYELLLCDIDSLCINRNKIEIRDNEVLGNFLCEMSGKYLFIYNNNNRTFYKYNTKNNVYTSAKLNLPYFFMNKFIVLGDTLNTLDGNIFYKINIAKDTLLISSKELPVEEQGMINKIVYVNGLIYLTTGYFSYINDIRKNDNFLIINPNDK